MSLKLQAEMCATCIFRPGNLMRLEAGRVRSMMADCDRRDTHVICHETLAWAQDEEEDEAGHPMDENEAVCRGYYDTGRRSQLIRIAGRLGILEEVPAKADSMSEGE